MCGVVVIELHVQFRIPPQWSRYMALHSPEDPTADLSIREGDLIMFPSPK